MSCPDKFVWAADGAHKQQNLKEKSKICLSEVLPQKYPQNLLELFLR